MNPTELNEINEAELIRQASFDLRLFLCFSTPLPLCRGGRSQGRSGGLPEGAPERYLAGSDHHRLHGSL